MMIYNLYCDRIEIGKGEKMKKTLSLLLVGMMILSSNMNVKAEEKSDHQRGFHAIDYTAPASTRKISNARSNLPAQYDLRSKGYVTNVKDQGQYGICWAFSSIASGESSVIKRNVSINGQTQNKSSLDLSEAQIAYSFYHRTNDALNQTSGDKNIANGDYLQIGGNTYLEAVSLSQWNGMSNEKDAEYKNIKNLNSNVIYSKNATVLENAYFFDDNADLSTLKNAIMQYGALTVSYNSNDENFNEESNSYYCNVPNSSDHAVTVVGWDDNYNASNFPKKGAWIVKNSWGSQWGDNGYFYLSYYDASLGTFVCHDMMSTTKYQNNYYYDGSAGMGVIYPYYDNSITAYQVFEGKKETSSLAEYLEAVQVGVGSSDTTIKIEVYNNLKKATDPTSGTKVATKTVTKQYAGIYTIDLGQSVLMEKGKKIVVKVTLTTSKSYVPQIMAAMSDNYGWVSFVEKTAANQSYIQIGNGAINDGNNPNIYGSSVCARVKALTNTRKKTSIASAKLSIPKVTYTGTSAKVKPTVKLGNKTLKEGTDYTISYTKSITNPGTGKFKVVGKGAYNGTTKEYSFTVIKRPVSQVTFKYSSTSTYTGKQIKPSLGTYAYIGNKKYKISTYFNVSYGKNKSTGTGTIKITPKKGSKYFSGSVTKTFYIVPKKVTISSAKSTAKGKLTIKYKKVTGASGYQIAYRKKGTSQWSYANLSSSSSSKTLSKLTSKKSYEVKVRAYKTVNKTKKYGSYSSVKTASIK